MFSHLVTLAFGKMRALASWEYFLFIRKVFPSGQNIEVPSNTVLQMHCPEIDGDMTIDGEVYIL